MTEPLRLSLAVSTEPRDSTHLDKDSSLTNCFIDKDPTGVTYVTKRAGNIPVLEGIILSSVRGIFYNPNQNIRYYISKTYSVVVF